MCPDCGLGCTTTLSTRYGELRRVQGRFNRDVNKMFLCDRGRFGFEFVNAPERVRTARVAAGLLPAQAAAGWQAAAEAAPGADLVEPAPEPLSEAPTEESARAQAAARSGLAPEVTGGQAGGQAAVLHGELALDAAAGLLRGRRAIGFGSPRASLEANYALRALVGPANFYLGVSDGDDRLVGAVLDIAADPRLRLGSAADIHDADAALSSVRISPTRRRCSTHHPHTGWHLRPNAVEERNHIRRWNDAGITRIKRREPSALWIATTHADEVDAVAAETRRAAPTASRASPWRSRTRWTMRRRPCPTCATTKPRSRGAGPAP